MHGSRSLKTSKDDSVNMMRAPVKAPACVNSPYQKSPR